MKLATESHVAQAARWPQSGEHILAHYDDDTLIVYQAYRPSIGRFAIEHGYLGGPDFSLSRMSWLKPNFLWMMHRCGWGTKEGQEYILGLRLRHAFFDRLLAMAVPSSFEASQLDRRDAWQVAVAASDVRLQWDPDHAPSGARLERRAIQLGLRGTTLRAFARDEIVEVIDMTGFVAAQRIHAQDHNPDLLCPVEGVYTRSTPRERA